MNPEYNAEETFLTSLPGEDATGAPPAPAKRTIKPPMEPGYEVNGEGLTPPPSSEIGEQQFNFTPQTENLILACLIRHPDRFYEFGDTVMPSHFGGVEACNTMFAIKDYWSRYSRFPTFEELVEYAVRRVRRRNPDEAQRISSYVLHLSTIKTDNVDAVYDLAYKQIYDGAFHGALRKIISDYQEKMGGRYGTPDPVRVLAEIDPVKVLQDALNIGKNTKLEPRIEDCDDLLAEELETPPELIQGVLHKDTKLVLGGASKSFKSWSLLDMAVSIALGTPWWGLKTIQGRVLYVNFEIPRWAFRIRLQALREAKQSKGFNGNLKTICLRGKADDSEKMLSRVEREIGRDKYDLIILDPIYKMLGDGDENKAGDIAKILNRVEAMLVKTNAAVAFGAHYSKGNQANKESQDRIGGSGVFARDPDTLLNMTRHEEDDCFSVDVTTRNLPPVQPFVVRWDYPVMVVDNELNPAKLKKAGIESKYDANELAVLLAERPLTSSEWQTRALEELGMSRAAFYRIKNTLKNVVCEDKKYRISEQVSWKTLANNAND